MALGHLARQSGVRLERGVEEQGLDAAHRSFGPQALPASTRGLTPSRSASGMRPGSMSW